MDATIEVTGLRKRFGSTIALDGMTFTVRPGRVTGFRPLDNNSRKPVKGEDESESSSAIRSTLSNRLRL